MKSINFFACVLLISINAYTQKNAIKLNAYTVTNKVKITEMSTSAQMGNHHGVEFTYERSLSSQISLSIGWGVKFECIFKNFFVPFLYLHRLIFLVLWQTIFGKQRRLKRQKKTRNLKSV